MNEPVHPSELIPNSVDFWYHSGSHLRDPLPHDQEQESRVQESAAQGGHPGVDDHSAASGQTERPPQRTRRRAHAARPRRPTRRPQRPTRRRPTVRRRSGRSGSHHFLIFLWYNSNIWEGEGEGGGGRGRIQSIESFDSNKLMLLLCLGGSGVGCHLATGSGGCHSSEAGIVISLATLFLLPLLLPTPR